LLKWGQSMMPTPDFQQIYDKIEALDDLDLGFPYLQDKLADVVLKSGQAASLCISLMRMADTARHEQAVQRALYETTRVVAHREAAAHAQLTTERLQQCITALKVRKERLKALPQDLRTYMRMMEDQLALERNNFAPAKPQRAIATANTFDRVPDKTRDVSDADIEALFR
jgi:hypothetical protein